MEIRNLEGVSKKSLPLSVVRFLNKLVNLQEPEISVKNHDNFIWLVEDNDEESEFYFGIDRIHVQETGPSNQYTFGITYKPISIDNLRETKRNISVNWEDLQILFDNWLNTVREFESTPFILNTDEKRIVQYQEEFILQMPFTNNDGLDYFDLETQIKVDEYLGNTIKLLEEYKTDENSEAVSEIILDVEELKSNQTKYNKQLVRAKIAKIWAKSRSLSLILVKELAKGVIVDLIKGLLM